MVIQSAGYRGGKRDYHIGLGRNPSRVRLVGAAVVLAFSLAGKCLGAGCCSTTQPPSGGTQQTDLSLTGNAGSVYMCAFATNLFSASGGEDIDIVSGTGCSCPGGQHCIQTKDNNATQYAWTVDSGAVITGYADPLRQYAIIEAGSDDFEVEVTRAEVADVTDPATNPNDGWVVTLNHAYADVEFLRHRHESFDDNDIDIVDTINMANDATQVFLRDTADTPLDPECGSTPGSDPDEHCCFWVSFSGNWWGYGTINDGWDVVDQNNIEDVMGENRHAVGFASSIEYCGPETVGTINGCTQIHQSGNAIVMRLGASHLTLAHETGHYMGLSNNDDHSETQDNLMNTGNDKGNNVTTCQCDVLGG